MAILSISAYNRFMEPQKIKLLVEKQKAMFNTHRTLSLAFRKEKLKQLKKEIQRQQKQVEEALWLDLGKEKMEAYMCEIGLVYESIDYMLKHLDHLAKPKRVPTPLFLFPSCSKIVSIPYGCVLIVSPWNYPFLLSMQPMIEALAAGNTVILKPSNYSAHTSRAIEEIVHQVFPASYVEVVQGGRQENQALFHQNVDSIFFTGSPKVGQEVMKAASEHLVPITLELGGKSPCIVDQEVNLALAAKKIVFGKFLNAGQTCVAVDHVYVHRSQKRALLQQIEHQIRLQYPNLKAMGKIIDQKHFERVRSLLEDGEIVYGGEYDEESLQIAPTLIKNVKKDSALDLEEIFGPLLPIYEYEDFDGLLNALANKPHPLAAYLFSKNKAHIQQFKNTFPCGGSCVNNTILHLANIHLPFGGLQNSGLGHYHGKYGFERFSHQKSVLCSSSLFDLPIPYRPYTKGKEAIIQLFLK